MASEDRVLVMGIGNVLMKDEGVGCRVAEELAARYEFPANVEVTDSGTMGMMILNLFRDRDFILVIDAVDGTGHAAGTVVRMSPDAIAPNSVMHSLHDIRFIDVLEAAELIGIRPDAHCIGIQVEDMQPVDLTIGLSDPVEAAIETAIDAVVTALAERDIEITPRSGG